MYFVIPCIDWPNKNPVGYTRTTQKAKHISKSYKRYEAWKQFVWDCVPKEVLRFDKREKFMLLIKIYYNNDIRSDPSNVFKGIEDALAHYKRNIAGKQVVIQERCYHDDKYGTGAFIWSYDRENPRVEVKLEEYIDEVNFNKQLNSFF